MFKFNRLVVTVLLVGVAAVAWGSVKIPSFVIEASRMSCDGTLRDITLNPNADGMAILNYVGGKNKTIVQVILSDFTGDPKLNGLYFLRLDDGGDGVDMGMFLVGSQGNGNFHGEVSGDHSGSSVTVWAEPGACGKVLVATGSQ